MKRAALAVVCIAGCAPELGAPRSLVVAPQLLAVASDPAEAPPGTAIRWRALVASSDGTIEDAPLDWAFCRDRVPFGSSGVVGASCFGDGAQPIATATPTATAMLPSDACARFGPEASGETDRPAEPDATGGYYQPLRVELAAAPTIAATRLRCNLRGASLAIADAFRARYANNQNPTIAALTADADLDHVAPGATIALDVASTSGSAEIYPIFDLVSQTLADREEVLRVSWFATAGSFSSERTAGQNRWTAPSLSGRVHLWAVVRDDRGGVGWLSRDVVVEP